MEKVIATVTGYHGEERFKLIKLISHCGGNYVGRMSSANTHLVCWKFEGPKYILAKKLNTIVVNHQWVEECIRQGKRVPEAPYILESGEEVGPLVTEVPEKVVKEKIKFVSPYDKYFENPSKPVHWMDSGLWKWNEVSLEHKEKAEVKDYSLRGKRVLLKKKEMALEMDKLHRQFFQRRRIADEKKLREANDKNVKECVQHPEESTGQNWL
ncbi:unnamed protein product [Microthlaspi erraticum]|uniref:BRCT domain-containing protein n=1 Tax=Microthlaspi erraticum TaxID=1685480 RepID=A0A6D2JJ98_9BRAS|nr:unnamed protein product [Microthlaspi erraticum]